MNGNGSGPNRTAVWLSSIGLSAVIYLGLVTMVVAGSVTYDDVRATIGQMITGALGVLVPSPLFISPRKESGG